MNALATVGILITLLAGYIFPHQQYSPVTLNNWRMQNSVSGLFSDVQSKLKALEDAHNAGILNDAEYASKKAELDAQLRAATPQLDEATKQKLQALETAHQAGILSDEEYERKKAEILGQQPATAAPLIPYQDPQGLFQFQYPGGWGMQNLEGEQKGVALTRGKAALNIMSLPDGVSDPQQVVGSISEQLSRQWKNYTEIRRGEKKVGKQSAPMVEFSGTNLDRMPAHGQAVAFVSGIKGYLFILIAPENEPENSFDAIQPAWKTLLGSFTSVEEKGNVYRHAAGFSFRYPDGWTIAEQEGGLQLTPPNPSSTAEGPTELYFLVIADVSQDGIQTPDDPRVLEYLDQQLWTLAPTLRRTGAILPIDMRAGTGVMVHWGAIGTAGEVRARAFVGIIKTNGVVLIGIGLKERLEARDEALRQIFGSLGVDEAQPAPGVQEQTGMAASSTISAGEVGDANWGFKFRPPAGWKFQKTNEYILLGHDTIAGAIFVLPHMEESLQAVQTEMQGGLSEEGVQLFPTGVVQPFGSNAFAGEYAGIADGQQVKARGIGTFSPHGSGGAFIVAMTTPNMYGPQLSGAADTIARAIQYFKVEVSDLMRHFAGTWGSATTNTLTNITLGADGSYGDTYESSYSGNLTDGTFKTGNWGVAGQDQSKGRWTVRGSKQQGVITITSQDGTQSTLEYRVHVEKGETYWREYWFNGKHYSKIR
ncbi:SHOCT domain-containing protein [Candidatus Poribacteria bacterium]